MHEINLYKVSAFTYKNQGGNLAGVVLNADWMKPLDMQTIARKLNYSETAYVLQSEVADFKVRFFSPTNEIDLCGHATIATFSTLVQKGIITDRVYTQETKAGILKLDIQNNIVYMQQNKPVFKDYLDIEEVKGCFKEQDIIDNKYPIRVLSTGLFEIFVPIKSKEALLNLTPNMAEIIRLSEQYQTIGMHVFYIAENEEFDAYGRNFAPMVGIDEESATGTSNGALSCYINRYVNKEKTNFKLSQGISMNLPSEINTRITLEDDEIVDVYVGGNATIL